eukprot:6402092-Ditylum_brightwellii.AAC.1
MPISSLHLGDTQCVQHGGIPYALQQDGFTDPEASSTQVQTHVSTTGRPTRIQTWDIGSLKLGFSLPPWLTN